MLVANETTFSLVPNSQCSLWETGSDDFSDQEADAICNNVFLKDVIIFWQEDADLNDASNSSTTDGGSILSSHAFNVRGSLNMFLEDATVEPALSSLTDEASFLGNCYYETGPQTEEELAIYNCSRICNGAPSVLLFLTVPEVVNIPMRGSVDGSNEVEAQRVLLPDALLQQSCNVVTLSVAEANQCPILTENTLVCTKDRDDKEEVQVIPRYECVEHVQIVLRYRELPAV